MKRHGLASNKDVYKSDTIFLFTFIQKTKIIFDHSTSTFMEWWKRFGNHEIIFFMDFHNKIFKNSFRKHFFFNIASNKSERITVIVITHLVIFHGISCAFSPAEAWGPMGKPKQTAVAWGPMEKQNKQLLPEVPWEKSKQTTESPGSVSGTFIDPFTYNKHCTCAQNCHCRFFPVWRRRPSDALGIFSYGDIDRGSWCSPRQLSAAHSFCVRWKVGRALFAGTLFSAREGKIRFLSWQKYSFLKELCTVCTISLNTTFLRQQSCLKL